MPGRYIRVFMSWLGLIFSKITLRSYTGRAFHLILRLFQHYQRARGGKSFRERGLALSSQPIESTTSEPASVTKTLAVPVLLPPSEGSQPRRSAQSPTPTPNAQAPQLPITSPRSTTTGPFTSHQHDPAGQSSIKLTPIIPRQIKRYERRSPMC